MCLLCSDRYFSFHLAPTIVKELQSRYCVRVQKIQLLQLTRPVMKGLLQFNMGLSCKAIPTARSGTKAGNMLLSVLFPDDD